MLLQRLLANPEFGRWHGELASAHAIDVQNVADWMWASQQEEWGHEDIPCLAPPFPKVWMEWGRPQVLVMKNKPGDLSTFPSRVGCLGLAFKGATGWLWLFTLFVQHPRFIRPTVSAFTLRTDREGTIEPGGFPIVTTDYANPDTARYMTGIMRMPALLGIAFMHCKNVEMVRYPEADTTPKQVRRGLPRVRFSRIVVTPFREVAQRASGDAAVSIQRAMHICRGHFKDYRKSGLFGRIPGIFWWDTHVRGNADAGLVISEHEVRYPSDQRKGGVPACR